MLKRYLLLICCASLFAFNSCFAWNSTGHMMIAQIAYDNLTAVTKNKVGALLNQPLNFPSADSKALRLQSTESLDNFLLASVWPDAIKKDNWENPKEKVIYAALHILNVNTDITDREDCSHPQTSWIEKTKDSIADQYAKKTGDVVSGIESSIKTLQTSNESETNKGVALRHLIHLVGDIHQPYHLSDFTFKYFYLFSVKTYGANYITTPEITIPNYEPDSDKPSKHKKIYNWHALWDAGVGIYENIPDPAKIEEWNNDWSPKNRAKYLAYVKQQADSIKESVCQVDTMCQQKALYQVKEINQSTSTYVSATDWAANGSEEGCKLLDPDTYGFTLREPSIIELSKLKLKILQQYLEVKPSNDFDVDGYKQSVEETVKMYIITAGHKLADLLNAIYDPDNTTFEYNKYLEEIEENSDIYPLAQYIQSLL